MLRERNPFIECARRFGKTTSILCYVIERLMREPGLVVMWCEPWKNQARDIIQPELSKVFDTAPKGMRPHYQTTDSVYIFPNGSRMKMRGVNEDKAESARGSFAHIIVGDEFGSWKDPDYIVSEVLRPQLLTTNGQFIFASTPPGDLDHAYYVHKGRAIEEGRFIQKTIYDNESLTQDQIEQAKKDAGGEHTTAWRREYLCEAVADRESLVIPEYDPTTHDAEDELERPPHFDCYVGLDLGFNDNTAALFGYYDFKERCLVIEDELVCRGRNSRQITTDALEIEQALWGSKTPYLRVGDNDRQQLYDMLTMCNYPVTPTRKDDKAAAINALRLRFSSGQIKIKKRCVNLRYQLRVGLWNDRKTDFLRGEKTGHLDAVDALIYLSRNVLEHRNPYPHYEGVAQESHWINPAPSSQGEEALLKALRPFAGG